MLSAFSVTDDLSSCTRCGGIRSVSLDEFRRRIRGRPYRYLLRYHLHHHDRERIRRGLEGSLAMLSPAARRLALETAERWREGLVDGDLADADCAELVRRVRERARRGSETEEVTDDRVFDLFEAATLSVVLDLLDAPELRRAVGGLARGFLWRHRWNLGAAVVLAYLATVVEPPLWRAAVWAGLGLAVLPPLARLARERT